MKNCFKVTGLLNSHMAGTPPLQHEGPGKMQKIAKGGPRKILVCKGGTKGFFHVYLGNRGLLGPFFVGPIAPLPAMSQNDCFLFT